MRDRPDVPWVFFLGLFIILVGCVQGCTAKGVIRAEPLEGPLVRVLDRHDECERAKHEEPAVVGCEECLERDVALGDSIAIRAALDAALESND